MRPRLLLAAANAPVTGRALRFAIDEVDSYPAVEADPINLARRAEQARSGAMRLREKGKKDGPVITLSWDAAQAALAAGTHEAAEGAAVDEGSTPGSITQQADQGGDAPDDLDDKTRAELEALAKERGVDVSAAKNKADVIAALRAA